jgi:putative ABC transport system ATP-binding protein
MSLIETNNLKKIYKTGEVETRALDGVSFEIKKGEFTAIMGPSGSGKSTLLHILGFLDKQTSGDYRFNNKTFSDFEEEEIAKIRNKEMGFIFQSFNLLSRRNVYENVVLPLVYSDIHESKWKTLAEEAIEDVGLSHRLSHTPAQLSGGEKQRVAIARALINKPEVIFADEPTGNLDTKSSQGIMRILEELNGKKGHTIVLITHETYTAEHAERIIHILDGKVDSDSLVKKRRSSKDFIK